MDADSIKQALMPVLDKIEVLNSMLDEGGQAKLEDGILGRIKAVDEQLQTIIDKVSGGDQPEEETTAADEI